MQIELLSQCLAAWMEQEGVSVAGLTEMVGYKSKTSVFRLLKGQCNEQTREAFVDLLAPRLDGEWTARFRKALRRSWRQGRMKSSFHAAGSSITFSLMRCR